jgi:phytoene synthase
VSQYLADRRRYEAFIAMYSVMRVIDDPVDSIADVGALAPLDLAAQRRRLDSWRERIEEAYGTKQAGRQSGLAARPGGAVPDAGQTGPDDTEALQEALAWALSEFPVPRAIWTDFLEAMDHDLQHDRFLTPDEFLRYARGATAAPTTVFVYLLTAAARGGRGALPARYEIEELGDGFDYRACGMNLGIFAYLAHILRDVAADLRIGGRGRIYVPLSDLSAVGLTEESFRSTVESGRDDGRWRALVERLVARARGYEEPGSSMAFSRFPAMEPDCRFVLALIIRTYQDLLGRIEADPLAPLRGEVGSPPVSGEALIRRAAADAGYSPPGPTAPGASPFV